MKNVQYNHSKSTWRDLLADLGRVIPVVAGSVVAIGNKGRDKAMEYEFYQEFTQAGYIAALHGDTLFQDNMAQRIINTVSSHADKPLPKLTTDETKIIVDGVKAQGHIDNVSSYIGEAIKAARILKAASQE